jgi:nicotinate phosphoribosyltransferase
VAKAAKNKQTVGGRKFALRRLDENGVATAELIGVGHPPEGDSNDRPLLEHFVVSGEVQPGWTGPEAVERARARHDASIAELPAAARRMHRGEAVIPTVYVED